MPKPIRTAMVHPCVATFPAFPGFPKQGSAPSGTTSSRGRPAARREGLLCLSRVVALAFGPTLLACAPTGQGIGDAGPGDAGAGDAGASQDAGVPAPDAGGPTGDAGVPADPCANATFDDALGTLRLAPGFALIGSAPLPESAIAAAALDVAGESHVAVVDGVTLEVKDLGPWPTLSAGISLFSLLPADESAEAPFASYFLASTGSDLAAGYTSFDTEAFTFPGQVVWWNGTSAAWFAAEGNYSAAFTVPEGAAESAGPMLLVNGLSATTLAEGAAIYGVRDHDAWSTGIVATFPESWGAYSGYTAVTTAGIAVVGGFYALAEAPATNHLHALPSASLAPAAGEDVAAELGDNDRIWSGSALQVSAFGAGIAVLEGDYGAPIDGLRYLPLLASTTGVEAGPQRDILSAADACTAITLLAPMGEDLLVGLADRAGSRLLRIQQAD